jgi:drug/metabolite transporter (DMT)-like permease
MGLSLLKVLIRSHSQPTEARLQASDFGLLAAVVALGGIAGPVLMLSGLARVSGVAGALLLNLEAPFTTLLAVWLFREHLGRRVAFCTALIIAGAAALAYSPGELRAESLGVLAITAACLCWGLDNCCTQRLSLRDPIAIARTKALAAGSVSLALALARGDALPPLATTAAALLLGFASFGLSIVLDVYALRLLGAAREAAFFATAPFVGALAAIPLLGEQPGPRQLAAAAFMASGALLLLRERHAHLHAHADLAHEHGHVHDAHHQHTHPDADAAAGPHSHSHRHEPLIHDHPHVPDLHHRHPH